jgi:cytoskeletal protein CcmA (bactofilin family)
MKFDEKSLEKAKKMNTTVVFEGIHVIGDVKGSHNYYLNGELEGTIDLSALLIIGKSGKFKGSAKTENVIVEGEFEGKLAAKERVEIRDTGKFVGDILAPAVLVSDRAFFQGNVTMSRDKETGELRKIKDVPTSAERKRSQSNN